MTKPDDVQDGGLRTRPGTTFGAACLLGGIAILCSALADIGGVSAWLGPVAGSSVSVIAVLAEGGFFFLGLAAVSTARAAIPETFVWWASIAFVIAVAIRMASATLTFVAGYEALLHYAIGVILVIAASIMLTAAYFRARLVEPYQAAVLVTGILVLIASLSIPAPMRPFGPILYATGWIWAGSRSVVGGRRASHSQQ